MWLSNQAVKVHMSYLELPTTMNYLFQHQETLLPSAILEVYLRHSTQTHIWKHLNLTSLCDTNKSFFLQAVTVIQENTLFKSVLQNNMLTLLLM